MNGGVCIKKGGAYCSACLTISNGSSPGFTTIVLPHSKLTGRFIAFTIPIN